MKFARSILLVLGLLILIILVAIASLMYFIDPNKLKPAIKQEVLQQTGYQLTLEGNMTWAFFPRLSIRIPRVTLQAKAAPFVDLRDVRMIIQLRQLLHMTKKWQGDVDISQAIIADLHAQNVHVGVHFRHDVLTLKPITASVYGGTLNGIANGRAFNVLPHWEWDVQASNMQVKPMLQDLSGPDGKFQLSGVGQIKIHAQTQGASSDDLLKNVTGAGEFSIDNGVIEGVDLNYLVQTANALINKQALSPPTDFNRTTFSNLHASFILNAGVAATNDVLLVSPAFTTKAKGALNLLTEALHLEVAIAPEQTLQTQWEVPVLITGNVRHPDVRLDMYEVQKFIVKQDLTQVKAKASEEIKKHIPGKAGEFLQNLLGH